MSSESGKPEETKQLPDRLLKWLHGEGYPLEFRTAHIFRSAGFIVRQGLYVRGENQSPREIDVSAQIDMRDDHSTVRVSHIVECKWTRDHPWVIFTSSHTRVAPSACIAQMQGNDVGRTALWCLAGSETLASLEMFSIPMRSGFNGRQAFTKGKDLFYDSIQSAVSNATAKIHQVNHPELDVARELNHCEIARPLVVIDGPLFEAFFDINTGEMSLKEREHQRLYWKGSDSWPMFVAVDIVRIEALATFLTQRLRETKVLADELRKCHDSLIRCYRDKSLSSLQISKGSRGFRGQPAFLYRLARSVEGAIRKSEDGERT